MLDDAPHGQQFPFYTGFKKLIFSSSVVKDSSSPSAPAKGFPLWQEDTGRRRNAEGGRMNEREAP
jgi:hypothetical protein